MAAVQEAEEEVLRQAEEEVQMQAAAEDAKQLLDSTKKAANIKELGNCDKLKVGDLKDIAAEHWPAVTPFVRNIGATIGKRENSQAAWALLVRLCQQHGPDAVISEFST